MPRQKIQKQKLEVAFDPKKRKMFLSGFQQRKNERRKRAQEQFEKTLKNERKRIKQEVMSGFKLMKKSFEPLRELTGEDRIEKEFEDEDTEIRIVELFNTTDLSANTTLGMNLEETEDEVESKLNNSIKELEKPELPGMDINLSRKEKETKANNTSIVEVVAKHKLENISNKKDFNRLVKKNIKKLQKSKVFKKKERLDKRENEKKVKRNCSNTLKALPRHVRKNLKNEPIRYNKGRMMSKKQLRKKKQNMQ